MNKLLKGLKVLVSVLVLFLAAHILYLYSMTPDEEYPVDDYLFAEPERTALIIVAHDDDAATFSGTTALLSKAGWRMHFLTFYTDKYRPEEVPVRKQETLKAAGILGLEEPELIDLTLRYGLDTVSQPWMPMPYAEFEEKFNIDSLRTFIRSAITRYNPTVIFTLDDVIGGYGHPEHVLVGRVAVEESHHLRIQGKAQVKRIYQHVWPESQSLSIMGEGGPYAVGKQVYQCSGMPEPQVFVDISGAGGIKKSVLLAHASQHRNLSKFVPYYNVYPGWLYFKIFDKEHFRIIDLEQENQTATRRQVQVR